VLIIQKFLCPEEDMLCSTRAAKDNEVTLIFWVILGVSGRAEEQHRKESLFSPGLAVLPDQ